MESLSQLRKRMSAVRKATVAAKVAATPDQFYTNPFLEQAERQLELRAIKRSSHCADMSFAHSGRHSFMAAPAHSWKDATDRKVVAKVTLTYGTQDLVRHVATKPTIMNKQRKASRRPGPVAVYNGDGVLTDYVTTFKR